MFEIQKNSTFPYPTGVEEVEVTIIRLEQAHREYTGQEIRSMRSMAGWCMGEAKDAIRHGDLPMADKLIAEAHRLLELSGIHVPAH